MTYPSTPYGNHRLGSSIEEGELNFSLTSNRVPKGSSTTIADSRISDDGTRVKIDSDVLETLTHSAQTVTGSDVTGAANTHYICTIAGLTADRNLTLPAGATAGDKIRVTVPDGDATYELVIKGAATVTINGGSAATEWSRLLNADETVVFEATSATNWQVVHDGRIPCIGVLSLNADQSDNNINTYTNIPFQVATFNRGFVYTQGVVNTDNPPLPTAGSLTVRRAGNYQISGYARPVAAVADAGSFLLRILRGVPVIVASGTVNGAGSANCIVSAALATYTVAIGEVLSAQFYSGTLDCGLDAYWCALSAAEIL